MSPTTLSTRPAQAQPPATAGGPPHQRFGQAAPRYEQHAHVQQAVVQRLATHILTHALPVCPRVLEIGCGTGLLTRALAARIPEADWTITDLAPAMLDHASAHVRLGGHARFQVLDGERPDPAATAGGFDLICSSMALQWFHDLPRGLRRLSDLLAPGGWLAIAIPVQGTCAEWQAAHAHQGLTPATLCFPDLAALHLPEDQLSGEVHVERFVEDCGSALAFLRGLKGIGATTPRLGSVPLTVPQLRRVCAVFDRMGARCTYEIALGLWCRAAPDHSSISTQEPTDAARPR